jgi:hypothetical protein
MLRSLVGDEGFFVKNQCLQAFYQEVATSWLGRFTLVMDEAVCSNCGE